MYKKQVYFYRGFPWWECNELAPLWCFQCIFLSCCKHEAPQKPPQSPLWVIARRHLCVISGSRREKDVWCQPARDWGDLTSFTLQLPPLSRTNTGVMHKLKGHPTLVVLFTGGKASQSRSEMRSWQKTFTSHQGQQEGG